MKSNFEIEENLGPISSWRHSGNGLRVLLYPTPVAPVGAFGIVYEVGSRYEGAGQTGATHILEHLMFKGTDRFNRDRGTEIARILQREGAYFNATTWLDRTTYYETLPTEKLSLAMEIEADRMRGARVRAEDLASERTVVLNELERGENEPMELLIRGLFAHSFVEHPYHHPTIGWRSDVENISHVTLREFYDTYYHPNNATVIAAGEIEPEAVLAKVDSFFGAIPSPDAELPKPIAREPEQQGERRFQIHRAGEIGFLGMSWHIPEARHPDLPALSVAAQVLSEGVTSRLHQRLVETNICLSVHAYAMELHDPGVFQICATLAPGIDHDQVEGMIRNEVCGLLEEPPAEEEIDRAKIQVRTDLAFRRESPTQIVSALTEAVACGDWRKFVSELDDIAAVNRDDLVRISSEYLHTRNLTVGWFVPEASGGGGAGPVSVSRPEPCYLYRPLAERVESFDLPGGARLNVLANPYAPTVTVAGSISAGVGFARNGRLTEPGLTAAMLERGTAHHDRLSLARELENNGLQLGIEASAGLPSSVVFTAQGLAEQVPRLSDLLFEVLRTPTFPQAELDKLREQVLGTLARERQETFATAYGALTRQLFPEGHPQNRRPIEVREAEIRALTREDLDAYHRDFYGPNSLVLVVVGDVDAADLADRFSNRLDGWHGGKNTLPMPPKGTLAEPRDQRLHIADRPNLDVFLGHCGSLKRGDDDYAATVLGNSCLGQSTLTSRLGTKVRDEAGLTYGIYSRFFGTLHLPGPWAIYLSVAARDLEAAEGLCRSILNEYITHGPKKDELEDEQHALAGAYRVGLATNAGVARELLTTMTAGEELSRIDTYPEQILGVSRSEVVQALRRHFHPDRLILTAAGSFPRKE